MFTNTSGSTITNVSISYTGQTWRIGTISRVDRLDFQYHIGTSTWLNAGPWNDVDALDYTNDSVGTLASGSMLQQKTVSATLTGLSIANGDRFWIRWTDFNASGADDGMAVDGLLVTTPAVSASGPDISVSGNGAEITSGDITPSATDHTRFDNTLVAGGTATRTYTITNSGTATLGLGTVTTSGTHAADFVVTAQPGDNLAAGASATFTVQFDPSASGSRTATLSFTNTVSAKSPYTFAIEGTGTFVEVAVSGNGTDIGDGDVTPSASDHTDFGGIGVVSGGSISRTFTVTNSGNTALTLGTVTTSGTHAADFVVTVQPSSPLAAGGATTFSVAFDPSANGTRSAAVSFTTDDTDENPFNFSIQGTGLGAGISNNPASLNFVTTEGNSPASQTFTLSNVGSGTLNYSLSTNANWLSVSPSAGALTAGSSEIITVTVDGATFIAGTSNATITVTDPAATNSPRTVSISVTITAGAAAPSLSAATATGVGSTTATLGGTIDNTNGASVTERGLFWSTSSGFTPPGQGTKVNESGAYGNGAFSLAVSALPAGSTIYYRPYASNSAGATYLTAASFVTVPHVAAIAAADQVSNRSVRANWGSDTTGTTNYFIDAATDAGFTSFVDGYSDRSVGLVNSTVVTGLSPATIYYLRIRAQGAGGMSTNSASVSATTLADLPSVTTDVVTPTGPTTATSGGNVTADGGASITARGVCWSASGLPTTADASTTNGTGTGAFSSTLTGLTPGQTYTVRAYAVNSAGTAYGNQQTFTADCFSSGPTGLYANPTNGTDFTANWSAVTAASGYRIDVSTTNTFGTAGKASTLFFSEYVEGSSNNKYVEIFNGTGESVDLTTYRVLVFINGLTTPGSTISLSGTLTNGGTYVIANNSAALGPITTNLSTSSLNFNGDDAVALTNTLGGGYLDVIGVIGTDPGTEWGTGNNSTADNTIRRRATVTSGDTNPSDAFTASTNEWEGFASDTASGLGAHTFTPADQPQFIAAFSNRAVASTSVSVTGLSQGVTYFYRVRAESAAGCTSPSSATGSVTTLVLTPAIRFAVASTNTQSETNSSFSVQILSSLQGDATVQVASVGTALLDSDFTLSATQFIFSSSGSTTQSLTVTLVDDTEIESAEVISLNLTGFQGGLPGATTNFTATLLDIEPAVKFAVSAATVTEDVGTYDVVVQKTYPVNNVSGELFLGGSAGATDYSIAATNFTLSGATTQTLITVTISNDAVAEFPETIALSMTNLTLAATGTPRTLTLTIQDDNDGPQLARGDLAIIGFHMTDPDDFAIVALTNLPEGALVRFTDNAWGPAGISNNEATLSWLTPGGGVSAGTIVTFSSHSASAGSATGSFSGLATGGDQILSYQGPSTNPVFLHAINVQGPAVWQGAVTNTSDSLLPDGLTNNYTAVALTEFDNGVYNGTTSGDKVSLLQAIGTPGNWLVSDTRASVTFPADPFSVTEPAPDIAILGTNGAVVADGDVTPSAADGTDFAGADVLAGTSDRIFTITNSGALSLTITNPVISGTHAGDFAVTINPDTSSLAPGEATTFTVTFDPSDAGLRTATVELGNNDPDEQPYTFAIQGTGTLGGAQASFVVSSFTTNESAAAIALPITLSAASYATVQVAVIGGSATAGSDYTLGTTQLVFDATGVRTQELSLALTGDTNPEPSETVTVRVVRAFGAVVVSPSNFVATITDDEPTVNFALAATSVVEGAGTFDIVITKSAPQNSVSGALIVGGTASNPADYSLSSSDFTLTGATTSTVVTVTLTDDSHVEDPETLILSLTNLVGAYTGATKSVTATIDDDDAPPALSAGDIAVIARFNGTPDQFSIVLLTNVVQGQRIYFTDNGYSNGVIRGGSLTDGDGSENSLLRLTFNTNIAAGTIIQSTNDANALWSFTRTGLIPGGSGESFSHPNFNVGGDQCVIFQALYTNPIVNVTSNIYLHDDTAGFENAIDSATGASSPGLSSNAHTAVALNLGANAFISLSSTAYLETLTKAQWLSYIANPANWSTGATGNQPTGILSVVGSLSGPEVAVLGTNGALIATGDASPSAADGTDFGSVLAISGSLQKTFTITNSGVEILTLTNPVISGVHAADFTVATNPAASVSAGATTTFTLSFDPSAVGVRTATVSIANNDANENPYTFTVIGTGLATPAPTVTFDASASNVVESIGTIPVTVSLAYAADATVQVAVAAGATASLNLDYSLSATQFVFTAAGTTSQVMTVTVNDDGSIESLESASLQLRTLRGANAGSYTNFTLSIIDNDTPAPLNPGDIAIIGRINNGTPDSFSFLVLTNIAAGQTVYFTDNGFSNSAYRGSTVDGDGNEQLMSLVFNSSVGPGTIIRSTDTSDARWSWTTSGSIPFGGAATFGNLAIGSAGDQLYAFQVASLATNPLASATTHLFVLDDTGGFEDATDAASGAIPSGLSSNANTALSFNLSASATIGLDLAKAGTNSFNTKADWLAFIGNLSNWTTSASTLPSGGLSFGTTCDNGRAPVLVSLSDKTATAGSSLTFSFLANDPTCLGPALTATGLPSGASFTYTPYGSNSQGTFTWTPSGAQTGVHLIRFVATDSQPISTGQNIRVYVRNIGESTNSSGIPASQTNWAVPITNLSLGSSGNVTVQWSAVAGVTYDVYRSVNSLGGNMVWTRVLANDQASSSSEEATASMASTQQFFQIVPAGASPTSNGVWGVIKPVIKANDFTMLSPPLRSDRALNGEFGAALAEVLTGNDNGTVDDVGDEVFFLNPAGQWVNLYLDASGVWRDSGGAAATNVLVPGQGLLVQRNSGTAVSPEFAGQVGNTGVSTNSISVGWNLINLSEGKLVPLSSAFNDLPGGGSLNASADEAAADLLIALEGDGSWTRYQRLPDGQWYDLSTLQPASVNLRPGQAYYFLRQSGNGTLSVRY